MIRRLAIAVCAFALCALPPAVDAKTQGAATSSMPACPKSDPVVWVNTKSNVYHVQGDRYYGATKSGRYACTSKAIAMGAHLAKAGSSTKAPGSSAMPSAAPDGDASSPMPSGKKKKKACMATPAP